MRRWPHRSTDGSQLVVVVGALVLSACGSGFTREAAIDSFMVANTDATTAQAECVVDELVGIYTLDGLETELAAEPLSEEFELTQYRASFACGMRNDVRSQLIDQLQASGLSGEDARCAGETMADELDEDDLEVLISGELTDEFFDKYFVALEACDALPE